MSAESILTDAEVAYVQDSLNSLSGIPEHNPVSRAKALAILRATPFPPRGEEMTDEDKETVKRLDLEYHMDIAIARGELARVHRDIHRAIWPQLSRQKGGIKKLDKAIEEFSQAIEEYFERINKK